MSVSSPAAAEGVGVRGALSRPDRPNLPTVQGFVKRPSVSNHYDECHFLSFLCCFMLDACGEGNGSRWGLRIYAALPGVIDDEGAARNPGRTLYSRIYPDHSGSRIACFLILLGDYHALKQQRSKRHSTPQATLCYDCLATRLRPGQASALSSRLTEPSKYSAFEDLNAMKVISVNHSNLSYRIAH